MTARATQRWQAVGEGVFRRRYRSFDLNVGVVIGEGEVLVIDTRRRKASRHGSRTPSRWSGLAPFLKCQR